MFPVRSDVEYLKPVFWISYVSLMLTKHRKYEEVLGSTCRPQSSIYCSWIPHPMPFSAKSTESTLENTSSSETNEEVGTSQKIQSLQVLGL